MEQSAERFPVKSVFEALSLMIAFGTLVAVLSDKKDK
ncbi:putative holin-like toxin [Ligilactobacillus acidipiscis]